MSENTAAPTAEAAPEPPEPSGRPRWFLPVIVGAGVIVLAIIVVIVVLIVNAVTPHAFATGGTLSVSATGIVGGTQDGDECHTTGGFTDIETGAQIVVTDDQGKTVAVGELGGGKVAAEGLACQFPFTIKDIPAGSKFYKVEISHRGGPQYTERQLRSGLDLSIG